MTLPIRRTESKRTLVGHAGQPHDTCLARPYRGSSEVAIIGVEYKPINPTGYLQRANLNSPPPG